MLLARVIVVVLSGGTNFGTVRRPNSGVLPFLLLFILVLAPCSVRVCHGCSDDVNAVAA